MPRSVAEPVISFTDFSFKYKIQSEPTLRDINLKIYPGEKVLILGPSGSGKSTLANCINGLIPFSHAGEMTGSCKVAGEETRGLNIFKLSRRVGTVLQDSDAQFVGLSVGEDIAFSMENEATPRSEMLPRVDTDAGAVGMRKYLKALPFDLSGGEKQKTAMAGVLGGGADILLFDEPLASLDPRAGMAAVDMIDRLARTNGRTAVIIEHRLEDVLYRPIDRVVLMSEGRIAADAAPDELLRSDLLKKYGIREPLYITAMKLAGCDLGTVGNLADVSGMVLSDENKKKLVAFCMTPAERAEREYGGEALKIENVSFAYAGGADAVRRINLNIKKGERVAVIGKNGAGKSTMARLICGINRPREGSIAVGGEDAAELSIKEIGTRVGFVMQNPNQMIIKDIIIDETELALIFRDVPKEERTRRVKDALEACGLYGERNWPVDAVSYGQKKRVTVASVLSVGPDTIILDEPTAGQDYRHYTEIIDFINRLNADYGKTIIFITHDMHLAIENAERAVVFADGEIIADDAVFAVLSDDDLINRANLKRTSLYILANLLGIAPEGFIKRFTERERGLPDEQQAGN